MPTIRSHFSFQQFEEALQKLAHKIAIEGVTDLNRGDIRVVAYGNRFSRVDVGGLEIRFYAKHASYYVEPSRNYKEWWGFDVEEKLYLTSNHCSKISFVAGENDVKTAEKKKKISEFIARMMSEAGMKPVPRFSLAKHANTHKA